MSFLEFPIKRYQFTLVAFAMLVALGFSSYMSIPRQEDPYFPIAVYQIVVAYPDRGYRACIVFHPTGNWPVYDPEDQDSEDPKS